MSEEQNKIQRSEVLDQLVKELGIDTLSKDKQNELIIKMTEVLLKRIFLETMDKLGDNGREEYQKLTENDDATPEQVEEFFKQKIQDYDKMVANVIVEFKQEMLEPNSQ